MNKINNRNENGKKNSRKLNTFIECKTKEDIKKQFKKELMSVFQKFGYLLEDDDHEVRLRTTSGNIAWINITTIEIIK